GCPGGSNSLTFQGNSITTVTGDIWSNGNIFDQSGAAGGSVNGNVFDICPAPPAPLTPPKWSITGAQANGFNIPDPNYALPPINATSQTWNSTTRSVEQPGTYNADPHLSGGAGCYFLAAGVYNFKGGLTQLGGFISNELRPPDEPSLASLGSTGFSSGAYSVEVTAVRWEANGVPNCSGPASPTCYERESAPSMCRTVTLASSGNIKVSVTTDPGADDFKVYLATNATCTGLTYCTHTGTGNSNVTISSCPTGQPSPPDVQRPPLASTLPNTNP